ncbi:DUF5779 family protein [Natronosalvus halobius]|uniref:DUF5779 family protein n=1 Tax=Natronosalvus halobius TaxID=2953746 RepID=UPI00209D7368|nr:DUF5779 family protein [Natronosalvus halobius]USZ72027.1 DUF5779 family protein [Natronosalvus halobius]
MSDFDLDLRTAEEHIDDELDLEGSILLDVLDGSKDPEEWLEAIDAGNVLVLNVNGDVNELAAGFARDIKEAGGTLVHFRGFLIVAPSGIDVDTSRL